MKKHFLIFLVFLFINSCSKNEDIFQHDIVGKWQVIEFVDDIIDPDNIYDVLGIWEPVENGRIVEFYSNKEFNGLLPSRETGTFQIIRGRTLCFLR